MKLFAILALVCAQAFAASSVTQSLTRLGSTSNYTLTVNWTADASTGAVSDTYLIRSGQELDNAEGYYIYQVETAPGNPSPTALYDIAVKNSLGTDIFGGALANRSASVTEMVHPYQGAVAISGYLTLAISNNAVNAAKGTIVIYLSKSLSITGSLLDDSGSLKIGTTLPGQGIYLYSTFSMVDRKVYLLSSTDGVNFGTIGGGPVFEDTEIHDPSLAHVTDSTLYNPGWYMVYTWHDGAGTQFGVARSDSVASGWANVAHPSVAAGIPGVTYVWAPHFFHDTDGTLHITWASCVTYPNFSIYESHPTSRDLTTWSTPVKIEGLDLIDSQIWKVGSTYYIQVGSGSWKVYSSPALTGPYTLISTPPWSYVAEGGSVVQVSPTVWRRYASWYSGLWYWDTTDFVTWGPQTLANMPAYMEHGSMMRVFDVETLRQIAAAGVMPQSGRFSRSLSIGKSTDPAAALDVVGGLKVDGLGTPGTPTITANVTSTQTWGYKIVAYTPTGLMTLPGAEGTITTGGATLNGSVHNDLAWTATPNAHHYGICRTTSGGTPATTGLIGTAIQPTFRDDGLAVTGVCPSLDTSAISIVRMPDGTGAAAGIGFAAAPNTGLNRIGNNIGLDIAGAVRGAQGLTDYAIRDNGAYTWVGPGGEPGVNTPDTRLARAAAGSLTVTNGAGTTGTFIFKPPTACTGLAAGVLWNDAGTLKICP